MKKVDKTLAAGRQNRWDVYKALPGTRKAVAEKTGIPRQTVDGIMRQFAAAGKLVSKTEHIIGVRNPVVTYTYIGEPPPMPKPVITRPPPKVRDRVQVPYSQFKTVWIGGKYPEVANV